MTISVTGGLGGVYTLVDLAKMLDPNQGRLVFCANTLARRNPFVREFPIMEANQILTHVGNRDASLPTVQKRAINDGVPKSAHKEVPITAPMSLFETMNQIDEEILRLAGGNAEAVRQRKDARFIEAMGQAVMDECFYGSLADDVLGFNGLAVTFNLSTAYPNGDSTWYYNVQLAGGGGSDTTSIWAIEPGPEKVHLIYPKGTQAGIEINDLGKQLATGITTGTQFVAFVTQFKWRCGIFVQDERCVQRIANIETAGESNIFDYKLLVAALNRLPSMGEDPATRIYVNRTMRTQMDVWAADKNNVNFTSTNDAAGKPILYFRGVPVQVCDGILNTETAIS
jgi:hypothetical protein